MENKKQMDDIKQLILTCIAIVSIGAIPIAYKIIPMLYYKSQLPITFINF